MDLPAWVQAVGSVAALFVAIWIASAQSRRDERRRADETFAHIQTVAAISKQVSDAVREAEQRRKSPPGFEPANLDHALHALEGVNLVSVADAALVQDIIDYRRTAFFYRAALTRLAEAWDVGGQPAPIVFTELDRLGVRLLEKHAQVEKRVSAWCEAADKRFAPWRKRVRGIRIRRTGSKATRADDADPNGRR